MSFDPFDDAVKKMDQGALDAVMFVGGAPVPFIAKLDARFHFVRLPGNPGLEQIYFRTSLGKKQYGWADPDTETFSVPSAIMGVDHRSEQFAGQMQQMVLSVGVERQRVATSQRPSEVEERLLSKHIFPIEVMSRPIKSFRSSMFWTGRDTR